MLGGDRGDMGVVMLDADRRDAEFGRELRRETRRMQVGMQVVGDGQRLAIHRGQRPQQLARRRLVGEAGLGLEQITYGMRDPGAPAFREADSVLEPGAHGQQRWRRSRQFQPVLDAGRCGDRLKTHAARRATAAWRSIHASQSSMPCPVVAETSITSMPGLTRRANSIARGTLKLR